MVKKRKLSLSKGQLPLLTSIITAQKIFRIVFQTVKGIDAAGAGLDLFPGVVGKRVKVAFRLWLAAEQRVQIRIVHALSPQP